MAELSRSCLNGIPPSVVFVDGSILLFSGGTSFDVVSNLVVDAPSFIDRKEGTSRDVPTTERGLTIPY